MTSENLVLGYKIEFPFLFIRKIDTFSIILLTFCLFVGFFYYLPGLEAGDGRIFLVA